MTGRTTRTGAVVRWLLIVGLVLVNVVVFAVTRRDLADTDAMRLASESPSRQASDDATDRALFVGGAALNLDSDDDVAAAVAERLAWTADVVVPDAAAYTSDRGRRAGGLVEAARERPVDAMSAYDHVVFQGGELDADTPGPALETAVLHLLDELRVTLRADTSITLIGPLSTGSGPQDARRAVNEVLRAAANNRRVHYVDALSKGWVATDDDLSLKIAQALSVTLRVDLRPRVTSTGAPRPTSTP